LFLSFLLPSGVRVYSWDLVGRKARCADDLIPERLGGLDLSWGEEGRAFVGHIFKDACSLCTLIKQTHLIQKKRKKRKKSS